MVLLVASKIPTDAVVAICADEIGKDSLILQINETKVRIVGVHETPLSANSDLQHWCRYVILDSTLKLECLLRILFYTFYNLA